MLMAPMVMVAESEGLKSEEELAKAKRNQTREAHDKLFAVRHVKPKVDKVETMPDFMMKTIPLMGLLSYSDKKLKPTSERFQKFIEMATKKETQCASYQ